MTIQEAAYNILNEVGNPLGSRKLAKIALERGMVTSYAKDPVQSLAQTIEKNIRDEVYNSPKLIFLYTPQGRLIGLPIWEKTEKMTASNNSATFKELKAKCPVEILEKIRLAEQAKLARDFDETVILLLKKGLSAAASEIKKGLIQQLNEFEAF
ncbi:MAG: hypothetical protein JRH06_16185 [Deltaproteobacteria bacterium]|nr:hypothetical protein [Deltaproteobacteria bacterium]MBW2139077.1 hypothetical protein [Deltaproteobacteria bacterium]